MSYRECVACSGDLVGTGAVRTCARCGGVHVEGVTLAEALKVVNFAKLAKQAEEERYFDVTYSTREGVERVHGWFNPATREMTQIG